MAAIKTIALFALATNEEILPHITFALMAETETFAVLYDGKPLVYGGGDKGKNHGQVAFRYTNDPGRPSKKFTVGHYICSHLRTGRLLVSPGRKPATKTIASWSPGHQLVDAATAKTAAETQKAHWTAHRGQGKVNRTAQSSRTVASPAETQAPVGSPVLSRAALLRERMALMAVKREAEANNDAFGVDEAQAQIANIESILRPAANG